MTKDKGQTILTAVIPAGTFKQEGLAFAVDASGNNLADVNGVIAFFDAAYNLAFHIAETVFDDGTAGFAGVKFYVFKFIAVATLGFEEFLR